jgi:hypothetical protein
MRRMGRGGTAPYILIPALDGDESSASHCILEAAPTGNGTPKSSVVQSVAKSLHWAVNRCNLFCLSNQPPPTS